MTRYLSLVWLTSFAFVLASSNALALPIGTARDAAAAKRAVPNATEMREAGVDFTSIVALSNCSGSLVRFTTSRAEDKAMVLTNGHCLEGGMPKPGVVVVNKASSRSFTLLKSTGVGSIAKLSATKVLYATMTKTDMTLYELSLSYEEIQSKYNVQALTISDRRADIAAPIRVVSGYWKKIYSCDVDGFAHQLKEDAWTMTESLRYTRPGCEVIGGTSGSPVIHADTKEVVAVNNTINENGEECTMNNPCEVSENGTVTATKGVAYGQQLYWIYTCLDDKNQFDLTKEGCQLAKPQLSLTSLEQ